MPNMLRFWLIVAGLVAIIAASVYYILGGFDKVEIIQHHTLDRIVMGDSFQGSSDDSVALAIFQKYKELLLKDRDKPDFNQRFEDLVVVNYPTEHADSVNQFIGLILKSRRVQASLDQEIRPYHCDERYIAFLQQHPIVRPSAEKVEKMIRSAAEQNGQRIAFFHEIYYQDNSASVEGWVLPR